MMGGGEVADQVHLTGVDLSAEDLFRPEEQEVSVCRLGVQRETSPRDSRHVEKVVDQSRLELDTPVGQLQDRADLGTRHRLVQHRRRLPARIGVKGVRSSWLRTARNRSLARVPPLQPRPVQPVPARGARSVRSRSACDR